MLAHRALVFAVPWEDARLGWLLIEFRLLVNESIRIALEEDIRSRARLTRAAYKDLSARHAIHKQYIPSALEVALAVLKVHRRRVRKRTRTSIPFIRRLLLKAENQSYRLDRETGRLRIPIRGTEGVQFHLPLSEWHRAVLSDSSWGLGSLTVVPGKIIVVVRKEAPKPYEPHRAIALDTNEDFPRWDSGIGRFFEAPPSAVRRRATGPRDPLPTRRRLARKKAFDRRVGRRLLEPGALRHDVVSPLYDLLREGGGAREEPSGVESRAGVVPSPVS